MAGALLVVLGLVGAWCARRDAPTVGAARPVGGVLATAPGVAAKPESSPPVEAGGLRLRAVLEGAHPFGGEARLGAAFISPEDERQWEAARREGWRGAGPERREDLANVASWERAPVVASASGGVLGPQPVPRAERYQVMAWEPDGTFWWESWTPDAVPESGILDMGVLRARRPTGVRVRLEGVRPEHGAFSLRVARVVAEDPRDVERASELWPLVRHAAPRVAAALEAGTALPLEAERASVLLPLPPDPAVRLWLRAGSGQEAGPVEVPLREGRVEDVVLDVATLFPRGLASTLVLRGRVSWEGASTPPPGARLLDPEGREVGLSVDGGFVVEGVPSWRPSRFTVETSASGEGRPRAPAQWAFLFTPPSEATEVEVTWRVPAYRWLVLDLDPFARSQLETRARRPYPVFLLERQGEDGTWLTESTEHFLPEAGGLAVSVARTGTYRVQVAASPVDVQATAPVSFGVEDRERHLSSTWLTEGVACAVRVLEGDRPVPGASITLVGARGSLPPLRVLTDVEGLARLGFVREGPVQVEVSREGRAAGAGDVAPGCLSDGVAELRL
ncbi:carboxypeptidase regulatory-like domain-containing protein [Myxococcus stipitatus]|uniref:carboxypeptidase regulatory-like domain-containing protein n=1 Tax=Myxococcus stipitatus TaxID=83455 RepID=UPI001F43D2F2|nr:carboxypeptidase regulatory-like domain-containing protein [Myxococcus stipitatus]MCE9670881.1 carboxypeptidase regulatory-like domain-containing protein [Myxococcus stipitatus]